MDLLKPEGIKIGGAPGTKDEAIDQLVDLMDHEGNVSDKAAYAAAVREREAQFSTGLGDGIAIPHAKTTAVSAPGLAAMTVPAGVDYQSLDGEPATLLFLIAAPRAMTFSPSPPAPRASRTPTWLPRRSRRRRPSSE